MNRRHRNRDALWQSSGQSFLAWATAPAASTSGCRNPQPQSYGHAGWGKHAPLAPASAH